MHTNSFEKGNVLIIELYHKSNVITLLNRETISYIVYDIIRRKKIFSLSICVYNVLLVLYVIIILYRLHVVNKYIKVTAMYYI